MTASVWMRFSRRNRNWLHAAGKRRLGVDWCIRLSAEGTFQAPWPSFTSPHLPETLMSAFLKCSSPGIKWRHAEADRCWHISFTSQVSSICPLALLIHSCVTPNHKFRSSETPSCLLPFELMSVAQRLHIIDLANGGFNATKTDVTELNFKVPSI